MNRSTGVAGGTKQSEAGFSLIEIVMAVLILTIGLLGLAGTTGFVLRQTTLADVTTERAVVTQSVVERIRAMDFEDVGSGSTSTGSFTISWSVTDTDGSFYKTVRVTTTGPGLGQTSGGLPRLDGSIEDTFTFQVVDLTPSQWSGGQP